jgi:hypothetical protein
MTTAILIAFAYTKFIALQVCKRLANLSLGVTKMCYIRTILMKTTTAFGQSKV